MELSPEVKEHYQKIGKLGRKAVNAKYSKEIRREWARRGGRPVKIKVVDK